MPAWWGRKSTKNKEESQQQQQQQQQPHSRHISSLTSNKGGSATNKTNNRGDQKPNKSFDEVSALVLSRNFRKESVGTGNCGSSSGFSGFDSERGHPLPRPSISSTPSLGIDHAGSGSGSGSVSSVSCSGSSDDHNTHLDHPLLAVCRGHGDAKFIQQPRSPGPGSRVATTTTSPLHPRFSGTSLDSPRKLDDGRSESHRLPLPPGSPTSPSALLAPRTSGASETSLCNLSKWKKGRLLGRGTFGHVYLGFNSGSGQMCAIKEVRVVSDDQTLKECLKQLNQEITLLSQLSHPNIVQYYGSELGEETLSVYLEYVSGGSIYKLLQEYGRFGEPVIQNYTRQILSGLAYLHARNTVHRDIKGANILVNPNGEIKLADFGMAKHIKSCSSMLSFKGSPYWMALEVVMNTNGYGLPVDIWSLGCTILEMATSKPRFGKDRVRACGTNIYVAAIFKIGNSKDIPEIPEHLSVDAKDQATTRVANVSITNDAFPYTFDGSRTPTALEMHSNRTNIHSFDGDYKTRPVGTASRAMISPSTSARTITSLHVSPCSSPLRQNVPAYKSCFLSPTHPSYAMIGQNGYNVNNSVFLGRPNTTNIDPWYEIPQFKAHTPGRSLETRPIL
ncbi:hypothetical protein RJ639_009700 [Escallonia herrerae]|uniref:mitogen-activated protein kinase kinase kinase n=1 Tax=Escallonia herrerae TaxID=1293975 RepID=A0AA88VTN8_9ASTE|nr:hypothetical protein RJ639_009700 [Escallonia herrerae]